ncbi:hypothetical protein SAMN05444507_102108 [Pseudomonas syringae]|nr:hypothetical protein SAMN05444507_102108 [Pseudomonas syringae]
MPSRLGRNAAWSCLDLPPSNTMLRRDVNPAFYHARTLPKALKFRRTKTTAIAFALGPAQSQSGLLHQSEHVQTCIRRESAISASKNRNWSLLLKRYTIGCNEKTLLSLRVNSERTQTRPTQGSSALQNRQPVQYIALLTNRAVMGPQKRSRLRHRVSVDWIPAEHLD